MTSIAEPNRAERARGWLFGILAVFGLTLGALMTPLPWGALWLLVPVVIAVALLGAWRFGRRMIVLPVALLVGAGALGWPLPLWALFTPFASMTGVWMGLREEGGGPASGSRAWMLLPMLVFAAALPFAPQYPELVSHIDAEFRSAESQAIQMVRQAGLTPDQVKAYEGAIAENARLRPTILPFTVPTALFLWASLLIGAGRMLAARLAAMLKWPPLSNAPIRDWRMPDGALAVLIAGLALVLFAGRTWGPTAWTLLINAALGYCVQGIAVVESLLLARGVPPTVIVVTLLFVFAIAMPPFMVAAAFVGLSDVWLDYRRLEPSQEREA